MLLPELPPVLLPGLSAPPYELPLESPKYEKMLWRQLGWLRSVFGSKLGAESSLLVSPANVKLGCCPLVLEELVELLDELLLLEAGRRSIQGTATCLPEALEELPDVDELALALLPELLEPPEELSDKTAKSIRPEAGLMMVSLIVPSWLPDVPVTCAPVNWLALTS